MRQLFFANATLFADEVLDLIEEAEPPARRLVVSAEAITSVDSTAESMLRDLVSELKAQGVTLELARPKKPLRDFLDRAGLLDEIGSEHLYPRVSDAVDAFLVAEGEWVDAPPCESVGAAGHLTSDRCVVSVLGVSWDIDPQPRSRPRRRPGQCPDGVAGSRAVQA